MPVFSWVPGARQRSGISIIIWPFFPYWRPVHYWMPSEKGYPAFGFVLLASLLFEVHPCSLIIMTWYFSLPRRRPNIWKVVQKKVTKHLCAAAVLQIPAPGYVQSPRGWLILSFTFFTFLLHFLAGVRRGRSEIHNENWRPLILGSWAGWGRRRRGWMMWYVITYCWFCSTSVKLVTDWIEVFISPTQKQLLRT